MCTTRYVSVVLHKQTISEPKCRYRPLTIATVMIRTTIGVAHLFGPNVFTWRVSQLKCVLLANRARCMSNTVIIHGVEIKLVEKVKFGSGDFHRGTLSRSLIKCGWCGKQPSCSFSLSVYLCIFFLHNPPAFWLQEFSIGQTMSRSVEQFTFQLKTLTSAQIKRSKPPGWVTPRYTVDYAEMRKTHAGPIHPNYR